MVFCPYCRRRFKNLASLNLHIIKAHKDKQPVKSYTYNNSKVIFVFKNDQKLILPIRQTKKSSNNNASVGELSTDNIIDKGYQCWKNICLAFDEIYNTLPKDDKGNAIITQFTGNKAAEIFYKHGFVLNDIAELFDFIKSIKNKYNDLLIRLGIFIFNHSENIIKLKIVKLF